VRDLVVYPKNMEKNLHLLQGLIFSQKVLLALVDKGESRENAYLLVQRNAMQVWKGKGDFKSLLKRDREVTKRLKVREINACFDMSSHLANVDHIFKRVFGESK
ncbi:MAG: adenylosuccinate lyase, partial [Deltaproteobacteria bacterium]|nr:adenylosuccinate lyase [Deltaproteobacteria bacterium]